jgi:replication factor C subunit 1
MLYTGNIESKIRYYFCDYNMMPLLVQEHYLHTQPRRAAVVAPISLASAAADDISASDVLSKHIRHNGRWDLLSEHAVMSCILPSYSVAGPLTTPRGMASFPMWLPKNSTTTKNKRLLKELQIRMRAASGASSTPADTPLVCGATQEELIVEYMPMLYTRLTKPLADRESDGVDEVVSFMQKYGLTREDWETVISDLSLKKEQPKISSTTRTSLTKKCNAQQSTLIVKPSKIPTETGVAPAEIGEKVEEEPKALPSLEDADVDETDDGNDDDDDDLKKDKLIKATPLKKSSAKGSKATSAALTKKRKSTLKKK